MDLWQVSLAAGIVSAAIAVAVVGWLAPHRRCPKCSRHLPKLRRPTNRDEALHGGWTCPGCGCRIDRHGRERVKGVER
jgi:hypothetical protein